MSLAVLEQGRLRLVRTVLSLDDTEPPQKSRLADSWPLNDVVRSARPLFFTSVPDFLDRYPRLAPHQHGFHATAAAFLPLVERGSRSAPWACSTRTRTRSPSRTTP